MIPTNHEAPIGPLLEIAADTVSGLQIFKIHNL